MDLGMEFVPYYVSTSFCCLIVSKTKNDMAILQQEIERLSFLEEECNKKLDEFYASKQEFEFMLRNLTNKILGVEIDNYPEEKQLIDEFTDYVMSVWQFGADKLGQAQKKLHYISIVEELPLSVYLQAIQNAIEKGSLSIAQNVCHPYCSSLFYSMYTEITGDLFTRLSSADICFRQYEYLKRSLPFLSKLKEFIKEYIEKETICSIKLFSDEIISGISLKLLGDETFDDKENLGAFRQVVNLLTGELLGHDSILDPHSEVMPIVGDILYQRPGKKAIVKRLADFFLKDELEFLYDCCDKGTDKNIGKKMINGKDNVGVLNNSCPITVIDNDRYNQIIDPTSAYFNLSDSIIDVNGTLFKIQNETPGTPAYDTLATSTDPFQQCFQPTLFNQASPGTCLTAYDINNFTPPRYFEPQGKPGNKYNITPGRRGRKSHSSLESSLDINCDLKPIKIPKLKQDLIKPLT